jgi:hypothetical protein
MPYDNSNSGVLNPTREKTSERSPDWYGRLQISGEVLEALKAGKSIRISGWNRSGQYGQFVSLKVELERPRRDQVPGSYDMKAAEALSRTQSQPRRESAPEEFNDDIPF